MSIEEARAVLEAEVREDMMETPNPSKNESWIAATMQAADEYVKAVVEDVLEDVKELLEAGVQCGEARTEITYLMPTATEAIEAALSLESQEA